MPKSHALLTTLTTASVCFSLLSVACSSSSGDDSGGATTADAGTDTGSAEADAEIAALSVPSTPRPADSTTVGGECSAWATAVLAACPDSTTSVSEEADVCVLQWRNLDARGCGAAYRAYIACSTTATVNCESGSVADCAKYKVAYSSCTGAYDDATDCLPDVGSMYTPCGAGGTGYPYECSASVAPFGSCTDITQADDTATMFCCG